MHCLSCGCDLHIRADGACLAHGCPKKIEKWESPKDMQPSDEGQTPPKTDAEAAAPKQDAP